MIEAKEIASCVDRMAEIKQQVKELEAEFDVIEAKLLKQFETDVEDTKYRTVKYSGTDATVTANYSDKVTVLYPSMLKTIFGEAYKDVVTEETKYTLSANAKRLLAALYKREYMRDTTVEGCLSRVTTDDKALKVLAKKVKGKNFEGDKNNLKKIAGLDEETASDYAYMITEAAAWQEFEKLMCVSGGVTEEKISTVLDMLNAAVLVEETPKITVITE